MKRIATERKPSHSGVGVTVAVTTLLAVLCLACTPLPADSFVPPASTRKAAPVPAFGAGGFDLTRSQLSAASEPMSEDEIKRQLTEYLAKRKEANADAAAEEVKGTVVGGTRGNAVLEFISGAPARELVIERAPDVFDYDELSKYGYSGLVKPIMDQVGGRRAVYDLMGMEPPPLVGPPPKKKVPKLMIDRTGEDDKARYTGLKMGQVLDDDVMGEALAAANEKAKEGKDLRPKLVEESYVQPFADKRNTSPMQTPDWTPEKLDEYAIQQGRAQSWARRSRMGEFVKDPFETSELPLGIQAYAVATAFFVAFAYGRATPRFLAEVLGVGSLDGARGLQDVLQVPGLALALASVGSSAVCAAVLAPGKNRNGILWGVKGFLGGPIAVVQLRGLDALITREQKEKEESASSSSSGSSS